MQVRSYSSLYEKVAERDRKRARDEENSSTLERALFSSAKASAGMGESSSGFQRMLLCRQALEALDRRGWDRSYHQRYFHDHFIRACSRVFWKVFFSQKMCLFFQYTYMLTPNSKLSC